jgi:predicted metal-dependent HD superfamily phosphohydrolase
VSAPESEIRRAWRHAVGTGHDDDLDHVLMLHRESHRRYHTAVHVMWVLRHIHDLASSCAVADLGAIESAALFHDAVYDPRSTTNEPDSAALAVGVLTRAGWSSERVSVVRELIMCTAHHPGRGHPALSIDQQVLVDADLSILGSSPAEYTTYATAVRAEFAHVTDRDWTAGRSSFLRGVLAEPTIFHTDAMRSGREQRARANIGAELAMLSTAV